MRKQKAQRVCHDCALRLKRDREMPLSLPSLPFSVLVTLSSYLPISSTLSLSRASKSLHRIMTSRDFDNTFWHYCHDSTLPSRPSLAEYISANEQSSSKHSEANEDSFQLSVQISRAHEDTEVGALYCTDGCRWRLAFIETVVVPRNLACALSFLSYPLVGIKVGVKGRLRCVWRRCVSCRMTR